MSTFEKNNILVFQLLPG